MSEWIKNVTGIIPCAADMLIEVRTFGGVTVRGRACHFVWGGHEEYAVDFWRPANVETKPDLIEIRARILKLKEVQAKADINYETAKSDRTAEVDSLIKTLADHGFALIEKINEKLDDLEKSHQALRSGE